jgi:hypothetical protein
MITSKAARDRVQFPRDKENDYTDAMPGQRLAGETALAAAMLNQDWVAAHEKLGRNRPGT